MNTWQQVLPDYEIICWDTKKFDINSNRFAAQAFAARKWAFAPDSKTNPFWSIKPEAQGIGIQPSALRV
jgi:hypothetical protein